MNQTFRAFQKQVRTTMFMLEKLHITVSPWFLMEIPFGNPSPPSITDPMVAEKFRNHPFLALARELYSETVHRALDELKVIGVHAVIILVGPFVIFVSFNLLWVIRIWEFGPRDLDEGGPIQDEYKTVYSLDIPVTALIAWLGSMVAAAVIVPQTVSLCLYYLVPRDWGYREVFKCFTCSNFFLCQL